MIQWFHVLSTMGRPSPISGGESIKIWAVSFLPGSCMVHQWQLGPNIAGKSLFLASKGAKRRASKGSSIAMFDYQRVSLDHFGPFHFHVTIIYIYIARWTWHARLLCANHFGFNKIAVCQNPWSFYASRSFKHIPHAVWRHVSELTCNPSISWWTTARGSWSIRKPGRRDKSLQTLRSLQGSQGLGSWF